MSMGEQSHPLLSGHIWSPIMRSSRGKFFIFLAGLGTLCFILFLLSNTHSNLKQLEAVNERCQQQRDSLSAQLQVVYEHKNRLEKSLQQEKTDHKHTREEHQDSRNKQETELKVVKDKQLMLEKQLSEIKSNYAELESERKHTEDSLKEQIEVLQNQKDEELKKLQAHINQIILEKDKLEQEKSNFVLTNQQNQGELNRLRIENQQMKDKFDTCDTQLKNSKIIEANVHATALPNELNKESMTSVPVKLPSKDAASPNEKVLPRPHIEQNVENNNIEMENKLKDFNDVGKGEALRTNEIKNNSQLEAKNILPLPMLLKKQSDAYDKPSSERPEDNEIKDTLNVLKPPPFNENLPVRESVNQPAEKGEYVHPLGQVEQPDFKDHKNYEHAAASNLKKFVIPAPNINEQGALDDAAQVQDMLNKSPGDTNDIREGVLNMPPHGFHLANHKVDANQELHLVKANAELPDDKQYAAEEDDDDQDGDNEEEMGAGIGQGLRAKAFQEQDFDDQEPNENVGPKEVDGVVVMPK